MTLPRRQFLKNSSLALASAAEQLNLSYADTVELLEAHRSVIARRSNKTVKPFEVKDWIELYRAIKKVFG